MDGDAEMDMDDDYRKTQLDEVRKLKEMSNYTGTVIKGIDINS